MTSNNPFRNLPLTALATTLGLLGACQTNRPAPREAFALTGPAAPAQPAVAVDQEPKDPPAAQDPPAAAPAPVPAPTVSPAAGSRAPDPLRVTASAGLGSFESSFGLFLRGDGAYSFDGGPWGAGAEAWLGFASDSTQFRLFPYAEYTHAISPDLTLRGRAGLDIYSFNGDDVGYGAFGLRGGAAVEYDLAAALGAPWTAFGSVNLGFLTGDIEVDTPFGTVSTSETSVTFDLETGARYQIEGAGAIGASLYIQSFDAGDFVGLFGTYTF